MIRARGSSRVAVAFSSDATAWPRRLNLDKMFRTAELRTIPARDAISRERLTIYIIDLAANVSLEDAATASLFRRPCESSSKPRKVFPKISRATKAPDTSPLRCLCLPSRVSWAPVPCRAPLPRRCRWRHFRLQVLIQKPFHIIRQRQNRHELIARRLQKRPHLARF